MGATVIITGRNEDRLAQTTSCHDDSFNAKHQMTNADPNCPEDKERIVCEISELYGKISTKEIW
jgi:short-subunit dehydrogenase